MIANAEISKATFGLTPSQYAEARFRFCSFYLAANGLWKTLDFCRESAMLAFDGDASIDLVHMRRANSR